MIKIFPWLITLLLGVTIVFSALPVRAAPASPTNQSPAACQAPFSLGDLTSGDILIPPFLRTADAAQSAGFDCILAGITYYTDLLLVVIAVAAFLFLLYGGFLYVSAFGDEAKVLQAKKVVTNALVGIVLASLAGALLTLVKSILKVS